jgi:hypothetical protein
MKLSFFENILIGAALMFLTALQSKITNPTELAALQAAITFLQDLTAGTIGSTPAA